jgi:carbon-monoxide dehydrogenase large subunit
MATYIEACAFAGSEEATVELGGDGSLTLLIGTQTNGQGHATAYGQIIAEQFGVDLDRITTIQGDTDRVRKGGGTGGSRSIPIGLPSVLEASRSLVKKIKDLAADKLEAGPEDLELVDGEVRVVGTDRSVTLAEIAAAAPETLSAREEVKQAEATYPNGTHICELEVDPETGDIELLDYVIVDDFGVTVNPILLAGQVHGGVVQAIGQALMEHTVYDEDGQLLTASFLDYQMPRAADIPGIRFETNNIPSTTNALGIKGAGEAGTIGAGPAVMNAVGDALRRGAAVAHIDMPATPLRVWEAIRAANS